jgi:hypothetical protein
MILGLLLSSFAPTFWNLSFFLKGNLRVKSSQDVVLTLNLRLKNLRLGFSFIDCAKKC